MAHVFISYKHTDSDDFARSLRQELENAGFDVWWDDDIPAGEDWRREIDQAIEDAFALVVIMTPEARKSEYITYEWACARGAEKPVIPLMWKSTGLHPRLDAFQYIDFAHSDHQIALDKLIKRLQIAEEQNTMYKVPRDAPPAVRRAVADLASPRADERKEALETLAGANHPSARAVLIDCLSDTLRDVRFRAAFLLGNERDVNTVPGLISLLGDQYPDVRQAAAGALGQIGDKRAVPKLIVALHDEFRNVREAAAGALGEIGDKRAVPTLLEVINDRDVYVCRVIISALGKIGDARAVPALIAKLDDEASEVYRAAEVALEQIGTPEALAAVKEWRERQSSSNPRGGNIR
jgi:hypothetical protein